MKREKGGSSVIKECVCVREKESEHYKGRESLMLINCSIKDNCQWNLISRVQSQFISLQQQWNASAVFPSVQLYNESTLTEMGETGCTSWKAKEKSSRPMTHGDITKRENSSLRDDDVFCPLVKVTDAVQGCHCRSSARHNYGVLHHLLPACLDHVSSASCTLIGVGTPMLITNKNRTKKCRWILRENMMPLIFSKCSKTWN